MSLIGWLDAPVACLVSSSPVWVHVSRYNILRVDFIVAHHYPLVITVWWYYVTLSSELRPMLRRPHRPTRHL